jgi:hypothetical protein
MPRNVLRVSVLDFENQRAEALDVLIRPDMTMAEIEHAWKRCIRHVRPKFIVMALLRCKRAQEKEDA